MYCPNVFHGLDDCHSLHRVYCDISQMDDIWTEFHNYIGNLVGTLNSKERKKSLKKELNKLNICIPKHGRTGYRKTVSLCGLPPVNSWGGRWGNMTRQTFWLRHAMPAQLAYLELNNVYDKFEDEYNFDQIEIRSIIFDEMVEPLDFALYSFEKRSKFNDSIYF